MVLVLLHSLEHQQLPPASLGMRPVMHLSPVSGRTNAVPLGYAQPQNTEIMRHCQERRGTIWIIDAMLKCMNDTHDTGRVLAKLLQRQVHVKS